MRRWHVLTMVHFAAAVPSHSVVGLPSLSPTMVSPHAGPAPPKTLLTKASAPQTEGSISSWLVSVGEEVEPGDVFCEIETDKATVEMECQDTCAPPPPPPPPPPLAPGHSRRARRSSYRRAQATSRSSWWTKAQPSRRPRPSW